MDNFFKQLNLFRNRNNSNNYTLDEDTKLNIQKENFEDEKITRQYIYELNQKHKDWKSILNEEL